ncbi:unnamed protein product, partial [Symbiodinium microadriaticum]
ESGSENVSAATRALAEMGGNSLKNSSRDLYRKFWEHFRKLGVPWSLEHPARGDELPISVTLRPVLLRAVWSLNLALQGRRPGNSRPLSMKFATCEIKGDWKFYVETFELRQWYTCNRICHRCNAANVENKGPLFSNFGTAFRQNDTMAFINEVLPDQPSPLVLLSGFHVRWLRWCLMHNCNLGLFQVETAEALLLLAETACLHDPNLTMQGALKQSYKAFKTWCRAEKVSCTVRPWKITQFHLGKDPREPTQHPWINFKAYNARCVLAFVAAAEVALSADEFLQQLEQLPNEPLEMWKARAHSGCRLADWQNRLEKYGRYLNKEEAHDLHDRGYMFLHAHKQAADDATKRGRLRFTILPKYHAYEESLKDIVEAKAEERSGAAAAAPQERSAADVDMATDMTDAAVADPSLTLGELVDKTTQKLEYMSAYMEGASRMVGFEGALSCRAGAEHRRVLEHAQELLQKSEEYLKERAAEAGAAASGAPSSGSAAPGSDARLLEGIDAFMGKDSAAKAEDQDDPMEGPSKKEESSSEELVPDDPGRAHKSASKVPRQLKACAHVSPPPATMAAYTDETRRRSSQPRKLTARMRARTVEKASTLRFVGSFTGQRTTGSHSRRRFFPTPTTSDQFRQDFRGQWFRINREGVFFELTEAHHARSVRKLGPDVVIPLLVKGDRIRLKDGTRLLYGEGFDEESEEVDVPSPAKEDIPSYGGGVRGPIGVEICERLAPERAGDAAQGRAPQEGRVQQGVEARAAGVEYDAGAASSQQEADPPGQPIPFNSAQYYRWGTWVCYFCGGVNPPEADDCFYQPVGGPHAGARCGGSRAAGSWCPDLDSPTSVHNRRDLIRNRRKPIWIPSGYFNIPAVNSTSQRLFQHPSG